MGIMQRKWAFEIVEFRRYGKLVKNLPIGRFKVSSIGIRSP